MSLVTAIQDRKTRDAEKLVQDAQDHMTVGNVKKAEQSVMQAINLYAEMGNDESLGKAYFSLAGIYRQKNPKDRRVAESFKEALVYFKNSGSTKEITSTYNEMADVEREKENYAKAMKFFSKALKIDEKEKYDLGVALDHNNIAALFQDMGDRAKAMENYNRALSIYETVGDLNGIALVNNNLGQLYFQAHDHKMARTAFEKSAEAAIRLGDRVNEAKYRFHLGEVLEVMQDEKEALRKFKEARDLNNKYNPESEELGRCYEAIGSRKIADDELDNALKDLLRASEIYTKLSLDEREVSTADKIGKIYYKKQEYQLAIDHYSRGLETQKKAGSKRGIAIFSNNLGSTYHALRAHDTALKHFIEAEKNMDRRDYNAYVSTVNNITAILSDRKEYSQIIEYYKKAIKVIHKNRDDLLEAREHIFLGDALILEEKYAEAKEAFNTAIRYLQRKVMRQEELRSWLGDAYIRRAKTEFLLESLSAGIGDFKRGVILKGEESNIPDFRVFEYFGDDFMNRKEYRNAARLYDKAIAASPGTIVEIVVRLKSTRAYLGLKKKGNAKKNIEIIREIIESEKLELSENINDEIEFYYGIVLWEEEKIDEAMEHLSKVANRIETSPIADRAGEVYAMLGMYEFGKKEYAQAREYLERSLPQINEDFDYLGETYMNLGESYIYLNNPNQGKNYLMKAIAIFRERKEKKNIAIANYLIGLAFNRLSNYARAMEYYLWVIKGLQQIPKAYSRALCRNIGDILYDIRDYTNMGEYYERAVQYWDEDNLEKAYLFMRTGESAQQRGELQKALENYRLAIIIYEGFMQYKEVGEVYNFMGSVQVELEDHDEAYEAYDNALKFYALANEDASVMDTHINMAITQYSLKKYKVAFEHLETASNIEERMGIKSKKLRDVVRMILATM